MRLSDTLWPAIRLSQCNFDGFAEQDSLDTVQCLMRGERTCSPNIFKAFVTPKAAKDQQSVGKTFSGSIAGIELPACCAQLEGPHTSMLMLNINFEHHLLRRPLLHLLDRSEVL